MRLHFLQADIYGKFDALQKRGAGESQFMESVARGVLCLSLGVVAYLLLRAIVLRFVRREDRRGSGSWPGYDVEGIATMGEKHKRQVPLTTVVPGTSGYFFWEIGGLCCGCGCTVKAIEGSDLMLQMASDAAPVDGRARVVVPDSDGSVLFYDVSVDAADGGSMRRIQPDEDFAAAHIERSGRQPVNVTAAVLPIAETEEADEESVEAGGLLCRLVDVGLDGMGLRLESPLEVGAKVIIRSQFPGYLEPFHGRARVAWSRPDLAGLHRVGLSMELSGLDTRMLVADFMFGARRAQFRERERELEGAATR